ncbi:MAG: FHA domain-containing protein [Planctomycetes bacterium]|nr:FHA domain-containing protein [Planctomycetota bacterium]
MPRIYVLSGPDLGRICDAGDGATFGRGADCAVTLRDASVSRLHARLERAGERWRVVDVGSRNGLFAGPERLSAVELADGDEFRLGEVLLRFRVDAVPAARTPPSAAPAEPALEPAAEPEAGPALAFSPRGPSRAAAEPAPGATEPEEIELEGDWSTPSAPLGAPARPVPGARAPLPLPGAEAAPRSGASGAQRLSAADAERARARAGAGLGARPQRDARGVLQFHRVEHDERVLHQEFSEQPAWVRAAVVVLALAGAVALAWLGYRLATAAKAQLVPGAVQEADDGTR